MGDHTVQLPAILGGGAPSPSRLIRVTVHIIPLAGPPPHPTPRSLMDVLASSEEVRGFATCVEALLRFA